MNTHCPPATRRLRCRARRLVAVLVGAALVGSLTPADAFGQATYFYRGPTATWSTGTNWWTTYSGSTSPAFGPGGSDTAVFNAQGNSGASTAVLSGATSINRLLTLPTSTGGVTIRSDGTTRTLTLGSGGIRVQAGALTLGSASAGQGLNLVLAGSQDWRLGGQALTVRGTASGTSGPGTSQTLVIGNAGGIAGTTAVFTDGANGGKLNLWMDSRAAVTLSTASTFTGTLTLQSTGTTMNYLAGSRALISELQLAGGGLGAAALNASGTVRLLGVLRASNFNKSSPTWAHWPAPPAEAFTTSMQAPAQR